MQRTTREKSASGKARHRPPLKKPIDPLKVDWFPDPDADFIVWGRAAERAQREFRVAWATYQKDRDNDRLEHEVDAARERYHASLERAYPADFCNSLADLLAGQTDNLEPFLRFLEADLYFPRSGYTKVAIIRGLKRIPLTSAQQSRVQDVVLQVVDKGFRREFRDYGKLARHIQTDDWLSVVETRFVSQDPNKTLRARWILDACRKK